MKRTVKQLLALLAVLTLLLSVVPMVSADELPVFTPGTQEVTVPGNTDVQFTFTAPEAGNYNLYSESNCDPYIDLFDGDGDPIASDDDGGEGVQFFLVHYFEKDQTVTVAIGTYSISEQVVSVTVEKTPEPTGIDVSNGAEQVSLALFEESRVDVVLTPWGANSTGMTVSASDEGIVEIYEDGEGFYLQAFGVGTTTLTASVSETLSDSIDITVRPPIAWDTAKAQPVWLTYDRCAQTFAFTVAEEGFYKLMVTGDENADIYLYEDADAPGGFDYTWASDAGSFDNGEWYIAYLRENVTYYALIEGNFWEGKLADELELTLEPSDYEPLEGGVRFEKDSATVAIGELFIPAFREGYDEGEITITSEDEAILQPVEHGFVGQKVGEVTLTIELETGASDTMTVTVVETPVLELGNRTDVVFDGQRERMFAFTPQEDGVYVFRSYSENGDPRVDIYDDNWEWLNSADDDSADYNFCLDIELEGGKTYYLIFSSYNDNAIGYEVEVNEGVPATSVTLGLWDGTFVKQDGKTFYTYVGAEFYPTVKFGDAAGVLEESYGIEISDEDFITNLYIGKAGEVTVTVTTENGLTDSITVIAMERVAGDINLDGELSKDDVTALKNYLNGNADFGMLRPFADLNGDCVADGLDAALLREWLGITFETGDVNDDDKINTTDARVVLQYAAGVVTADALNADAADTNGDGKVNTTDARRILQYAAGIIEDFA